MNTCLKPLMFRNPAEQFGQHSRLVFTEGGAQVVLVLTRNFCDQTKRPATAFGKLQRINPAIVF
jgi:hypothetical protein